MNVGIGSVQLDLQDGLARVVFDRAGARNAMTWAMYEQLESALEHVQADPTIRVITLRGRNNTFVSGTDIAQLTSFQSGRDGLEYERRLEEIVSALESINLPTVAVIEGHAMGAGLIMAAVCDLRVCTPDARFGMPIARTVGNCLSLANCARLADAIGTSRTKAMIFRAESLSAEQAYTCGFVTDVVTPDELDAHVAGLCERIAGHAPISLAVTKEALRRIARARLPDGDDLIERAYGSRDFKEGVEAFLAKRSPRWSGR